MQLRKSFAIMTEVREPVFDGIYRWTRHPMYVGSMLTAAGALLQNFSAWNGLVGLAFCACQVYRARLEERGSTLAVRHLAEVLADRLDHRLDHRLVDPSTRGTGAPS